MAAPVFHDLVNNQLIGLPYPQNYKSVRVPTWYDHISLNGAVFRDFSRLERVYQIQIGWEELTASELADVQAVWEDLLNGILTNYTDPEGVTWSAKWDAQMMPLTWTMFVGSKSGSFVTLYTATLLFRAIGSQLPWP